MTDVNSYDQYIVIDKRLHQKHYALWMALEGAEENIKSLALIKLMFECLWITVEQNEPDSVLLKFYSKETGELFGTAGLEIEKDDDETKS